MSPRFFSRYLAAAIALLIGAVVLYAATAARRTQAELRAQLEDKARALAAALETGSRGAIRSNALLEDMIAQRLFDNARLVDELLRGPFDPRDLARLAARNRLRRIDLLDLDGRPWTPPERPAPGMPGMMMRGGMMRAPGREGARAGEMPMMRYMWGWRWGRPSDSAATVESGARVPPAIRDRKFWEGSVLGVAIGAESFRGIIAVHADADDVLRLRREIGVERQIEEWGRQPDVASVALLGPDLTVLAHSDPSRVGRPLSDAALAEALAARRPLSRLVETPAGARFEVVRPLTLDGARPALLAVAFSTLPMDQAWRRDVRAGVALGGAILLIGALGMGLVFSVQQRHLRERRALEAEMARRERLAALGDVAAAFAHEVRNPLNAVSVGLQRLRAEFAPEPAAEYARFVDLMQGEARRLNTIVEQFIALARPLPLAPAPLAVGELLGELAALVEGQARAAGVTVHVACPAGVPALVADRDRVKQVLLNLALNALEAMRGRGGALTLGAEATREGVALTVADTGPGIPPDALPRIFDPYFTTRREGLGLGLTIARRIVEAHGGRIDVETHPGRGSRFRVVLPGGAAS